MEGYTQICLSIQAPRSWARKCDNCEDFRRISIIGLSLALRDKIVNHVPAEAELFVEFEGMRAMIQEHAVGFWLRECSIPSEDSEVSNFFSIVLIFEKSRQKTFEQLLLNF